VSAPRGAGRSALGGPSAIADGDEKFMRQALQLALQARGRTTPNPLVGCVIVRGGRVLATGYHAKPGMDHAEAAALRQLEWRAPGATVYVTLEPHNHQGRTPPCTERLIAAGVARVVIGMRDPNPLVSGAGVRRLKRAGIAVDEGVLADECRAINRPYLHWMATKRPLVTLKAAITLDGKLAAKTGDSKWVSGEESRAEAHRMRDVSDAILVGAATVRHDDPQLTTRLSGQRGKDALRIVLDGRLSLSPRARVLPALIATTKGAPERKAQQLAHAGAEIVRLRGRDGRVDLAALLDELGRREIQSLLVEGGGEVHGQLLTRGLVDRVALFIAPKLYGSDGIPLIAVEGARKMADAWQLGPLLARPLGGDILVEADVLRKR
jgi:diaminohydroxyphosphoribosylaminopyrimidine deaminase/5-amino-6-(5-phosphoribosylamino)uracil reductase